MTVGPLLLGVLADVVSLRHGLLFVPALALIGVYTARPRADRAKPELDLVTTG